MTESGLHVDLRVSVGTLALDVTFAAQPGELVVLVGPNAAGKSTLLRAVAGLQPIDAGRIKLEGVVLDEPERNVFVDASQRPIGVMFQDGLLFDHLDVLDNIAFSLRCRRRLSRQASRRAGAEWAERLGIGDVAELRPRQLSGGQAQRVALARALAFDPHLLLLDEPMAALDATTRADVRRLLREHLGGFDGVRILVTHDPLEALALADRIIVLEQGRVVQLGSPEEIRARPRSRYVADLVGVNLLRGALRGATLQLATGGAIAIVPEGFGDGPVAATIHPRAVAIHDAEPHGSARNVWSLDVVDIDDEGDRVRLRLAGAVPLVAEITPSARAELQIERGKRIWASVKATEVAVHAD